MSIYQDYLAGLARNLPADVAALLATCNGADEADIIELLKHYPDAPEDLIGLLRAIKGTHYESHQGQSICLPVLASDVGKGGYPYYLRSISQIIEDKSNRFGQMSIQDIYEEMLEFIDIDERIDVTVPCGSWICFANCINNGGTSMLYIDFAPTAKGKYGQIIRYLHDPDSYQVIADDFSLYLQNIMCEQYPFIDPDRTAEEYCSDED